MCALHKIIGQFCASEDELGKWSEISVVPLLCNFQTVIMGRGKCLNEEEKFKIVQRLKQGKTINQISAIVKRDPRSITRFLDDPLKKTVHRDQGKIKVLSTRELPRVRRQLKKTKT